jgi:hypothetical protein
VALHVVVSLLAAADAMAPPSRRPLLVEAALAAAILKTADAMALYANDRDVLETLLYHRLQTLWHDCTYALAIFSKHRAGTELCGQKVWEALLTAFPLNHQRMQTVLLATEFGNLMAWDGRSKADVDRHFSNVSDTLEMLTFLGGNIDITDVFKAVILATLQSSKTKARTKAYSMILDSLQDSHDLSFEMIHRACVRQPRRRHDRGDDHNPEGRPATPHRASKDKAPRNLRSKSLSRADDGDVSAFLVNFLANHGIKAKRVLKDADLDPHNLHDTFALRALFQAAEPYIPETIPTDTDGDGTDCCSDSQASSASADD